MMANPKNLEKTVLPEKIITQISNKKKKTKKDPPELVEIVLCLCKKMKPINMLESMQETAKREKRNPELKERKKKANMIGTKITLKLIPLFPKSLKKQSNKLNPTSTITTKPSIKLMMKLMPFINKRKNILMISTIKNAIPKIKKPSMNNPSEKPLKLRSNKRKNSRRSTKLLNLKPVNSRKKSKLYSTNQINLDKR